MSKAQLLSASCNVRHSHVMCFRGASIVWQYAVTYSRLSSSCRCQDTNRFGWDWLCAKKPASQVNNCLVTHLSMNMRQASKHRQDSQQAVSKAPSGACDEASLEASKGWLSNIGLKEH